MIEFTLNNQRIKLIPCARCGEEIPHKLSQHKTIDIHNSLSSVITTHDYCDKCWDGVKSVLSEYNISKTKFWKDFLKSKIGKSEIKDDKV